MSNAAKQKQARTYLHTYSYPVNERHSSVLGYSATSQSGKRLWDELDWRGVREDGGTHIFNPVGGEYLHVRVKYDRDWDGPLPCPVEKRRSYRVRCWHEVGTDWRDGIVFDVKVEKQSRLWVWIVIVEKVEASE